VNEFSIRPAREADVPVVLQLIKALAEYERDPDAAVATPELIREALFGERPAAEAVIGWEGDQPVGFALWFHNFSTWLGRKGLYLEDLFVLPEKRGKGYGKALLLHLAGIARERGCGRMEWAVLDWNTPAIEFYKALGAKPMEEWTTFRVTREALEKMS
jgi:GNAT superfamily N-acetyltransferase